MCFYQSSFHQCVLLSEWFSSGCAFISFFHQSRFLPGWVFIMVCFSLSSGFVFNRVGFDQRVFSSWCAFISVFLQGAFLPGWIFIIICFSSGWVYSTGWAFIRVFSPGWVFMLFQQGGCIHQGWLLLGVPLHRRLQFLCHYGFRWV